MLYNNVKVVVARGILIASVDLTKIARKSRSGKSVIVGTTGGGKRIRGFKDFYITLTVYRKSKSHQNSML